MEYNDQIKFRLDGRWDGEGIVKAIYATGIEVELTKPCKEFDTGVMVIVDHSEIVN